MSDKKENGNKEILLVSKDEISTYLETMNNVHAAIEKSNEIGDLTFLINILSVFKEATGNLKDILEIEKSERILA